MKKAFGVAVVLMLNAAAADAEFYSGYELSQYCQTNKALVFGYIAGAMDKATIDSDILYRFYFSIYDPLKMPEKIQMDGRTLGEASLAIDGYCVPATVTIPEIADEFCKYLGESRSHKSAAEILGFSLKAAWPCK